MMNKGRVAFAGKPAEITDDLFLHYLGTAAGAR
jgi:hypothetical protein